MCIEQSFQRYLGLHWTFGPVKVELLLDQITFYWIKKKTHNLSAIFYSLVYSYMKAQFSTSSRQSSKKSSSSSLSYI